MNFNSSTRGDGHNEVAVASYEDHYSNVVPTALAAAEDVVHHHTEVVENAQASSNTALERPGGTALSDSMFESRRSNSSNDHGGDTGNNCSEGVCMAVH
eukprot:Lankesteria_metandrocarpae@DN9661_c0_g1_i1.p2